MSGGESVDRLPEWADQWVSGTCDCGARLVRVECAYCSGHVACFDSATDVDKCPAAPPSLRRITSNGVEVVQLRCPGCQRWGVIDDDQLHGRVSVDHSDDPDCSYHATRDWASGGRWSL